MASAATFSQTAATLIGEQDPVAAPVALSSIQFRDDGKTLVAITNENKMFAWTLPDGAQTSPPDHWRIGDDPIGAYAWIDRDYVINVQSGDGRTWQLPRTKELDYVVGYDPQTKRVYYYNNGDKGKITIYSALEGGVDRKKIASTMLDGIGDKIIVALGGQLFHVKSSATGFTVKDIAGKVIYTGARHQADVGWAGTMIETDLHVSPDGKRQRIDNRGERIVIRMSDGAELLHVDERFYRVALDSDNRYMAFLESAGPDDSMLRGYRIRVYFIGDEPGTARYMWLSGGKNTRELAIADQRRHVKATAESIAASEAREKQKAIDDEAARGAAASAPSSGSSSGSRVATLINDATGLLSNANDNVRKAMARRDEGAAKGNWCVYIGRAIDDINLAEKTLNEAASLYLPQYGDQMSKARSNLTRMRRDIGTYGCH